MVSFLLIDTFSCKLKIPAWSTDSFTITYLKDDVQDVPVGLIKTGIAWVSDKNVKFNNPTGPDGEDTLISYSLQIQFKSNQFD